MNLMGGGEMLELLIDAFISERRDGQGRSYDKFRCSSAGRCRLMRYWQRQGRSVSDVPDERARRVFEVGHMFHEWVQDILDRRQLLIEREKEVEDLHRIGHIDAIVREGGRIILYDFKTVHSRKFTYLKEGADIHYQYQITSYALMLPYDVDEARIAYISKDDLRIREIPVDYEGIAPAVTDDWNILINAWEKQVAPEPNPKEWECKYCAYGSSCEHSL